MPLGSRDIMMVFRANNQAQGAIREISYGLSAIDPMAAKAAASQMQLGVAVVATGIAFIAAGEQVLSFYKSAADAAIEYDRQSALTLTQVDQLGVSLETVKSIGIDVAKAIPAPFEQMQKSLFDIFSSMDVNTNQAQMLLTEFSKAAVAGQVDVQAASRASIALMNAYKIPIEDVSKVMDLQFQLVRKGVGTYAEFASSIGNAIPAAVMANQSMETLGGTIAFLTRNGLSAAEASTSAARSFELLSKPDTVTALKKLGVSVTDSSGNFRQMTDIVHQLAEEKGWDKLTGPALAKAFKDTFGTGTIQARRFFDLAIPNWQQYLNLTDDMVNSGGAMQNAYDIMLNQPALKVQELSNRFAIFKTQVGDALIPVFEKLLAIGEKVLNWWDGLDKSTQQTIIKVAGLAAVLAVVVGVVLVVAGGFMILAGVCAAVGVSVGTVAAIIAGIIAAFALLVFAVYQAIEHWDLLRNIIGDVVGFITEKAWPVLQNFAENVKTWFGNVVNFFTETVIPGFLTFVDNVRTWFGNLVDWITGTFVPTVIDGFMMWVDSLIAIKDFVAGIVQDIVDFFLNNILPVIVYWANSAREQFALFKQWAIDNIGPVIVALGELGQAIWQRIQEAWDIVFPILVTMQSVISTVFQNILEQARFIWDAIFAVIQFSWDIIQNVFTFAAEHIWQVMQQIWSQIQIAWDIIMNVFNFARDVVGNVMDQIENRIQVAWDIIQSIFTVVASIISGIWWAFWNNIFDVVRAIWGAIGNYIAGALDFIRGIINVVTGIISGDWGKVWEGIQHIVSGAWQMITAVVNGAMQVMQTITRAGMEFIGNTVSGILDNIVGWAGDRMRAFAGAIGNGINEAVGFVASLPGRVLGAIGNLGGILVGAGRAIMEGLLNGIKDAWNAVAGFLGGIADKIKSLKGPPDKDAKILIGNGKLIMEGFSAGLSTGWNGVQRQLSDYTSALGSSLESTSPVGMLGGTGGVIIHPGAFTFNIDNAKEDTAKVVQQSIQAAFSQLSDDWAGQNVSIP